MEQHGDHEDVVEGCNVWDEEDFSWINDWLYYEGDRIHWKSNEQLYQSPYVQNHMRKLANMHLGSYLPLDTYLKRCCFVPLFTDDKGEEYRIGFGQGAGQTPQIPLVQCPAIKTRHHETAECLFELKCRMTTPKNQNIIPPPRYIISLGQLYVKTSTRHEPVVECTDYSVVVGVDNDDMPVWILAPRKQLQDRAKGRGYPVPINALPIFDGLMNDGTGFYDDYFDAACILSSARRLGAQPSDKNAPNFQESCELVRKSRAKVDPVAVWQPRSKLLEYTVESFIPSQNAKRETNLLLDDPESS